MPDPFEIRNAQVADAPRISSLILSVAHYFDPRGSVAPWFRNSVSPQAIEGYIGDNRFNYLVAYSGQILYGVIAVRDTNHLYHLFVAPDVHRQGIATQLWERAKNDALNAGNTEGFFVRSSEYAVPVYERFGFRVAEAPAEKEGLVFVPMRLDLRQFQGDA